MPICLYQPLLSKRTDCFPPDCPHHRYGRRKPTVPGSHGFGRLYLPPVPGPAVSPLTVLTVSAAARLQPSIQTFRLSVMQIFCHADFQSFKKPPLSGILPDPRRLLPCPLSLIRSLFQKFAQIGKGGFLPLVLQHVEKLLQKRSGPGMDGDVILCILVIF